MAAKISGSQSFSDFGNKFSQKAMENFIDDVVVGVGNATEAFTNRLGGCLERNWPRSSISKNMFAKVFSQGFNIIGIAGVRHKWVRVLARGNDVPAHPIRMTKSFTMRVGKDGELKNRHFPMRRGQSVTLRHPRYKGVD